MAMHVFLYHISPQILQRLTVSMIEISLVTATYILPSVPGNVSVFEVLNMTMHVFPYFIFPINLAQINYKHDWDMLGHSDLYFVLCIMICKKSAQTMNIAYQYLSCSFCLIGIL